MDTDQDDRISIHALLAESDESDCSTYDTTGISIHALLAESDGPLLRCGRCFRISIHALLAESDKRNQEAGVFRTGFLSTLSLRRATR